MPAALSRGAANCRFRMNVSRASFGSRPDCRMPARQLTCLQPSSVAYAIALSTPSSNSAMRSEGDAALARGPVARGQVVQHLHELVFRQLLPEHVPVVIVRKQVFDAFEACFGGGGEAV